MNTPPAWQVALHARNAELAKVIRPLPQGVYEVHVDLDPGLERLRDMFQKFGGLNLTPDFQRGHVWSERQQGEYIDAILRGTVSLSTTVFSFNVPHWEDDAYSGDLPKEAQCIDGLQRLTALQRFMRGEIKAACGLSSADLEDSSYRITRKPSRVRVFSFASKQALLSYYLDLNTGGTVHSDEEIARVRAMREATSA